jgi:hypothetical protein
MEVLDKEGAALPLLVSTALLRVALMPLAHAFWRRGSEICRHAATKRS